MITLYNSSNAPIIPDHILRAIRNFDPNLIITFSEYAIMRTRDGRPRPQMKYRPRHHVWLKIEGRELPAYLFAVEDPEGNPLPVTENTVIRRIRGDLLRSGLTDAEIDAAVTKNYEDIEKKKRKAMEEVDQFFIKENAHLIHDAAIADKEGRSLAFRDSKAFSYDGQTNKTSSAEKNKIKKTNEEIGLIIPPRPNLKNIK